MVCLLWGADLVATTRRGGDSSELFSFELELQGAARAVPGAVRLPLLVLSVSVGAELGRGGGNAAHTSGVGIECLAQWFRPVMRNTLTM
jgi:hypothetical protein